MPAPRPGAESGALRALVPGRPSHADATSRSAPALALPMRRADPPRAIPVRCDRPAPPHPALSDATHPATPCHPTPMRPSCPGHADPDLASPMRPAGPSQAWTARSNATAPTAPVLLRAKRPSSPVQAPPLRCDKPGPTAPSPADATCQPAPAPLDAPCRAEPLRTDPIRSDATIPSCPSHARPYRCDESPWSTPDSRRAGVPAASQGLRRERGEGTRDDGRPRRFRRTGLPFPHGRGHRGGAVPDPAHRLPCRDVPCGPWRPRWQRPHLPGVRAGPGAGVGAPERCGTRRMGAGGRIPGRA